MINIKGFTLLELLIVVTILAIVASVGTVSYTRYNVSNNRALGQAMLKECALKVENVSLHIHSYSALNEVVAGEPYFNTVCTFNEDVDPYILSITITGNIYSIRATPSAIHSDSTDGILELTSQGIERWDKNNDGSFSNDENTWR